MQTITWCTKITRTEKPATRELNFWLTCDFSKVTGLTNLYSAKFYAAINSISLTSLVNLQIFCFIPFVTRLGKQTNSLGHTRPFMIRAVPSFWPLLPHVPLLLLHLLLANHELFALQWCKFHILEHIMVSSSSAFAYAVFSEMPFKHTCTHMIIWCG